MHNQVEWKDSVTQYPNRRIVTENSDGTVDIKKSQGEVIQQGTPMSATNFNSMENGIQDAHIAERIRTVRQMLKTDEVDNRLNKINAEIAEELTAENGSITLTNALSYPFNNSLKTVSIAQLRRTLNYDVTYEVVSAEGQVGEITISDKQLNGFKIAFDGSGTSVTIKYKIKGGMIA